MFTFRANAKAYLKHDPNTIGDRGDFSNDESLLGIVPHTIRGFLSSFSNVLPATPKYDRCIACSDVILTEYEKLGFDFIIKVLNSAKILEDLTGLSEIHNINDLNEVIFEFQIIIINFDCYGLFLFRFGK